MKGAIERSGYLFEQRLAPVFKRAGYHPTPNYRFHNQSDSISELDIYAISAAPIPGKSREFVWISLLVECKNLRCPLVFFTHKEVIRMSLLLGEPHIAGLPQQAKVRKRLVGLVDFLKIEDFHHYYSRTKISSQFCAIVEKKKSANISKGSKAPPRTADDFVAGHQVGELDLYSDAILKLVQAVEAEKQEYANRFTKDECADERVDLWLYYPIFVTAGALYECSVRDRNVTYKRVHRIGFLHRGHELAGTKSKDFRMDIVDPMGLRDLLKRIDREAEKIADAVRRKYRALAKSRHALAK
jgi:hypothetical protein